MAFKISRHLFFLVILTTIYGCAQNHSESSTDTTQPISKDITTYYFIRHAEKDRSDPNNSDPSLTEQGLKRAEKWANTLKNVDFDAIYSTDYTRTKQTAQPLANQNNLEIKLYDAKNLNDEKFQKETTGKTVMVVGHSNTTPQFANAVLGEEKYSEMDDSDNAGLYIVTIINGERSTQLLSID
ncbi:SixA phosphatase family protein [Aegicerativicinus sediminis]